MFKCEFCEKELSSKSSLKMHQTKTKYCLEKQNTKPEVLNCQYCNSNFTYIVNLKKHYDTCKDKIIKESENKYIVKIEELEHLLEKEKEKIIQLEISHKKEIENLKETFLEKEKLILKYENEKIELLKDMKPSVVNTNNYNNTNSNNSIKNKYTQLNNLDLSEDKVKKATEFYTIEHYDNGVDGLTDWCVKYVLTDTKGKIHYICTDKNRRNFVYRDTDGKIVNDEQAKKLKSIIKPLLEFKTKNYKKLKYNELADIDDDENEITENIAKIHNENKEFGLLFEKSLIDKINI